MADERLTVKIETSSKMAERPVPIHIKVFGEWKKIGEGVVDNSTGVLTATIDTTTPEGKIFLETFRMPIGGMAITPHVAEEFYD